MSEYDELQVSEWLQRGIAAARAGRRAEARQLLLQVVEVNDQSEQAWLWLSGVVDSNEDRLICLENVLTLNPDNAQAQAGLRHAQAIGIGIGNSLGEVQANQEIVAQVPRTASLELSKTTKQAETFLAPHGCVYCGLAVGERDAVCPHCGGRLTTRQFKSEERSGLSYLLHAYWVLLVGVNLADFFAIGYVWQNYDDISPFIQKYLPYFVGNVITGQTVLEAFVETELLVQFVRLTLLTLSVLGVLDALGLFLRRPLAHALGLVLVAVHLLMGVSFFVLGFLGYVMAAFRGLYTVMLTIFMFNTVEDFTKDERRERLEPDRHLVNDADYYARGRAYEKRGMWAKALLHWQRAAAGKPHHDVYLAAIARAYAHLGRYEQAQAQMEQVLSVSRTPQEWEPLRQVIIEAQRQAGAATHVTEKRS